MNRSRVFFVGAGASAADRYPITSHLVLAIAGYLEHYRVGHLTPSRIYEYLHSVHHVSDDALQLAAQSWQRYLADPVGSYPSGGGKLPGIIELLSLLDIAIADETSYGPSLLPVKKSRPRQFAGNELTRVRSRIVEAMVWAFSEVGSRLPAPEVTPRFVNRVLAPGDTIITTNWDTLLDRAIHDNTGAPASYGGHRLRMVDHHGRDLKPSTSAPPLHKLLKIHGSFSWLHCRRCSELYVNTQLFDPKYYEDRTCDCGSELQALLVAPTFGKKYNNYHLGAIWRDAQDALAQADECVFIGYSLPLDDLWIRAMMLRALGTRRQLGKRTTATVVNFRQDRELQARFEQVFGDNNVAPYWEGFARWIEEYSAAALHRT